MQFYLSYLMLSSIKPPRGDSGKFRSHDLKQINTRANGITSTRNWKECVPQAALKKIKYNVTSQFKLLQRPAVGYTVREIVLRNDYHLIKF